MKLIPLSLITAAAVSLGSLASAATLELTGYTAPLQQVNITDSPIAGTEGWTNATGFVIDNDGVEGIYWCLDLAHVIMNTGATQTYNLTSNPWSNAWGLTTAAVARVQAVFDANFGNISLGDTNVSAAFQLALWEAAFESGYNQLSLNNGNFDAANSAIRSLANTYLAAASSYDGEQLWELSFWEAVRGKKSDVGQNLVTATAVPSTVPVPAAGLLLIGALGALGVARRRKTA